jgi:dihydrofolate reductase
VGKIVISTTLSLDGVVQDPDGQEGSAAGGWFTRSGGVDLEAWAKLGFADLLAARALLLGRRSDHWFASRWTSRAGAFADRMNGIPKYVVSSTAEAAEWTNATVLAGDPVEEVAKLRAGPDGDILVFASYRLGRALLEHDLVDELRLVVFPVVVGAGERLFGGNSSPKPLHLLGTRPVGRHLTLLTYGAGGHDRDDDAATGLPRRTA